MNNFDKIRSLSKAELAIWLDKNAMFDNSPWQLWFDKKYCMGCEAVKSDMNGTGCEFSYCELHDKCRYFLDLDSTPDNLKMITLWLNDEYIEPNKTSHIVHA